MKRLLLAAALAASVAAAPAHAVTLVLAPRGGLEPQPYQAWADRAKVRTVDGAVALYLTPACPASTAFCNMAVGRVVALDVTPSRLGDRRDLLRQLGQVFYDSVSARSPLRVMGRDTFGLVYARCALRHGRPVVPLPRADLLAACARLG